jgi:hypothetical protein
VTEEEKKMDESLEAFREIVGILDRLNPECRERTVRAAMILVGSPIRDGEKHG